MPLEEKIVCIQCDKAGCSTWQNMECGKICSDCFDSLNNLKTETDDVGDSSKNNESDSNGKSTRKSTRTTRYKTKTVAPVTTVKIVPKGKGRRYIFKNKPMKAPTSVATVVTSEFVYFNGSYMQIGDIVSLISEEDEIYYAQIRGFLTDQYCEKSAVITWLLPTQASPPPADGFDPATYIMGPEEECPRKLDCMEFVMHAPSDYFKSKSPYPRPEMHEDTQSSAGFIWTNLERYEKSAEIIKSE